MSRRPRVSLALLRGVLVLHSVLVVVQPLMAGLYLSGDVDAINVHSPIGSTIWLLTLLQFVIAVFYWRPGGGRLWPAGVTALLFVAEFTQMTLGHTRTMAVHIPLGVFVLTGVLMLTIWSFGRSAARGRPTVDAARAERQEVQT